MALGLDCESHVRRCCIFSEPDIRFLRGVSGGRPSQDVVERALQDGPRGCRLLVRVDKNDDPEVAARRERGERREAGDPAAVHDHLCSSSAPCILRAVWNGKDHLDIPVRPAGPAHAISNDAGSILLSRTAGHDMLGGGHSVVDTAWEDGFSGPRIDTLVE